MGLWPELGRAAAIAGKIRISGLQTRLWYELGYDYGDGHVR